MSYTPKNKVFKQDGDPGSAAIDNDVWLQTSGGSTIINLKFRFGGAWQTSPTVAANTDLVAEGSTNLYYTNARADTRADGRISATVPGLITSGIPGAFTGSNQSLNQDGYQKFPGGITIQWGRSAATTSGTGVSFPVAFTTACYAIVLTAADNGGSENTVGYNNITTTGFNYFATTNSGSGNCWFAVGH